MARRRPKPVHGWDSASGNVGVVLGTPPRPYVNVSTLQTYVGESGALRGEPDPFYCQRIILDLFPYIFRFSINDTVTTRIWNWMILTAQTEALVAFLEEDALTLAGANLWSPTSPIFDRAARILQQGVAPVYDINLLGQEDIGGPLVTGATGPNFIGIPTTPFGPERVSIDIDPKFGLQQDHGLYLMVGPTATADWDDGDQLEVDFFYKALWTRRTV